jgi:hypothetical protein
MDCLANAPELPVESIHVEPDVVSSEVVATLGDDMDLPLWFGPMMARTPEARAQRLKCRPTSHVPWRSVVARWSIDRRQKWGDRANQLQDAGLGWKVAERIAFHELRPLSRAGIDDDGDSP